VCAGETWEDNNTADLGDVSVLLVQLG